MMPNFKGLNESSKIQTQVAGIELLGQRQNRKKEKSFEEKEKN